MAKPLRFCYTSLCPSEKRKEIAVGTCSTLEVLKQCFEKVVPSEDKRSTMGPLSFVVCLVYCYLERVAEFTWLFCPGVSLF